MATVQSKTCSLCKQSLPAAAFSADRRMSAGLSSWCKPCLAAQARARRNKDIEAFRAHQRAYYDKNRDHCRAAARDYYVAQKEVKNARSKAHYRANRAKYIALAIEYSAKHPERTRLIMRGVSGRRRAAERKGVKPSVMAAWVKAQKKVCHWCGIKCASEYQVDHIIPLSKGGPHELRNLCIACPPCNRRKNAKDPIEFAREMGKLL